MKIHPGVLEISRLKRGKNNILRPSSLTFDLWRWADQAQNLISSSTPGGAPLYQVWWKSTQRFLIFRVNEVKIAYLDQVHWPLTLGGSRPKSNQFIYSGWCTPVPSLMKIHPGVLPSSLTFDLWPWTDLAQNLISSSTPSGAPLYQVWWKSTQGFLIFRVNEGKIAYLDQVHWPLTLDVGRISPKIWSVHLLLVVHPCTKFDEIPSSNTWVIALTKKSGRRSGQTSGRTTRKHNASGTFGAEA